jgi:hypothetical protein
MFFVLLVTCVLMVVGAGQSRSSECGIETSRSDRSAMPMTGAHVMAHVIYKGFRAASHPLGLEWGIQGSTAARRTGFWTNVAMMH